jgi:hypothetical protein
MTLSFCLPGLFFLSADYARADTFTPVDVAELIAAINTANSNASTDIIELGANTFTLTATDNSTDGSNGLPSVSSSITLQNGTIVRAADAAGFRLIHISASGNLNLTNIILRGGKTAATGIILEQSGGAILNNGTLVMSGSQILESNALSNGGAFYNRSGSVTLTNSTLAANSCGVDGGGFYNNTGTVTLTDSTLLNNFSSDDGGGFYNNEAIVTLTNSTLAHNKTGTFDTAYGGAVYTMGASAVVTFINSTISNNVSTEQGGGIHQNSGSVTLINSTLASNISDGGGFGIRVLNEGILNLTNTLIADNTGPGVGNSQCQNSGTLATNINNLVEDNSCSPLLSGDPKLGPLQNNGGPTQTHALTSDSAAINRGTACSNPPVNGLDQRAIVRDAACDIGAFEFEGPKLTLSVNPDTFLETGSAVATITRNINIENPLMVTLTNSDFGEVSIPPKAEMTAGQVVANFAVIGIEDGVADGTQTVTLTASAAGYPDATTLIQITDTDAAASSRLSLVINPNRVSENTGFVLATVTRIGDNTDAITVTLSSSAPDDASVTSTLTIPAGENSSVFQILVINDELSEGTETVTITASASGFTSVSETLQIDDDEPIFADDFE